MSIRKISRLQKGFTLVELTLVITLMIALSAITMAGVGWMSRMADAKRAEGVLRAYQSARISWLVDNPTKAVEDVSLDMLTPYIPIPDPKKLLESLGYTIDEADVNGTNGITYTKNDDAALGIPSFAARGGK